MAPVTVSIATLPDRVDLLRKTIASLAPHVDRINLYLDGHKGLPHLPGDNITYMLRSDDSGPRRGDAGKFYWADRVHGYHFTCDDDIIYPDDYVPRMIAAIERYDRRACVGVLGTRFNGPFHSYYLIPTHEGEGDERRVYKVGAFMPLAKDWWCHALGTGTLAYHTDTLDVCRDAFELPNMADVWFALLCRHQRIPLVAVAREANWLTLQHPPKGTTIWERWLANRDDATQTRLVRDAGPWGEPLRVARALTSTAISTTVKVGGTD